MHNGVCPFDTAPVAAPAAAIEGVWSGWNANGHVPMCLRIASAVDSRSLPPSSPCSHPAAGAAQPEVRPRRRRAAVLPVQLGVPADGAQAHGPRAAVSGELAMLHACGY